MKWKLMIIQRDGDDGMKRQGSSSKNRLIKMEITRDKVGMVSFVHKLETWETMLEFGFIFTRAWNGDKLRLNMVSFFHNLETWEKTMLGFGFIFTQAWNKDKLCWRMVSVLHKLETEINYAWDKLVFP